MSENKPVRPDDYFDNLNLDLRTIKDMELLLIEYEKGIISRDEYLSATFFSHSCSRSKGFNSGFEQAKLIYKDYDKQN